MKINVINVVEVFEGSLSSVTSFSHDEAGMIEAENLYISRIAQVIDLDEENKKELIKERFFTDDNGWEVRIEIPMPSEFQDGDKIDNF